MNVPYSEESATRSSATLSTAARRDRDRRRREAARLARAGAKTPPFFLVFAKRLINSTSKKPKRGQKAKTLEADFKPHKAVVLARREISWEPTRHLHARVPGCEARVRTEGLASASLCPCARGPCEGATRERARSSPRPRNSRNPTGGGFPERKSWHSARRHDTLARDVLLSVHPRQARPSGNDLDRRAPGQKAEETADHGDGRRHRRSCVPHIFFSSPLAHPVGDARLVPGTPS